jgi:hypothetical protein
MFHTIFLQAFALFETKTNKQTNKQTEAIEIELAPLRAQCLRGAFQLACPVRGDN